MMNEFRKWPSIEKFSDVYHMAQRNGVGRTFLRPKIKLHGTNSAIRVTPNGEVTAQKRTSDITPQNDNAGFAAWVAGLQIKNNPEYFTFLIDGEWAGPGVQKGDAVAGIEKKKFFIFAARWFDHNGDLAFVDVEPDKLKVISKSIFGEHDDIHIIPWYGDTEAIEEVNFLDQEDCQRFIDWATEEVDRIGEGDPYIKETFGVEGPGEGLVFYNVDERYEEYWSRWLFKVKTEAHTVQKTKNRNHVAPEKPEGVDDFIEMFFTENRFRQILNERFGGVADKKDTGNFIKEMMSDVHKESKNEIELADFEWKTVAKYAVVHVKKWFFDEAEKL